MVVLGEKGLKLGFPVGYLQGHLLLNYVWAETKWFILKIILRLLIKLGISLCHESWSCALP